MPNYGMRYRPSCGHFQNTNSNLILCASLLDILDTGNTYYEIDEIILKMKKICFPFFLRVLNASFSYVFLHKIIICVIS